MKVFHSSTTCRWKGVPRWKFHVVSGQMIHTKCAGTMEVEIGMDGPNLFSGQTQTLVRLEEHTREDGRVEWALQARWRLEERWKGGVKTYGWCSTAIITLSLIKSRDFST